jgi:hypothetical protein
VVEGCYAYYTFEDWDCENNLPGSERDCGAVGQCNIYARVKITGSTPGQIEYLQSVDPEVWGGTAPGGFCDCPDSFGSLSVQCACADPPACQTAPGDLTADGVTYEYIGAAGIECTSCDPEGDCEQNGLTYGVKWDETAGMWVFFGIPFDGISCPCGTPNPAIPIGQDARDYWDLPASPTEQEKTLQWGAAYGVCCCGESPPP